MLNMMYQVVEEIKSLTIGYLKFYVDNNFIFLKGNVIGIMLETFDSMFNIVSGVLSMGPHLQLDHDKGDMYVSLFNSSWYQVEDDLIHSPGLCLYL